MTPATVPDTGARIRVADTPPTHCSSCFGQYPNLRHVDMGAAWDGPAFSPDGAEVAGGTPVTIDELVLCENCVKDAAVQLELTDEDTRRHVQEVEASNEELRERLLGATGYIRKLEDAVEARGKLDELLTKGAGS